MPRELSDTGTDKRYVRRGPKDKAAEVMSQWLGSIDYDDVELDRYERSNPG